MWYKPKRLNSAIFVFCLSENTGEYTTVILAVGEKIATDGENLLADKQ
jgi:hypothetical protein